MMYLSYNIVLARGKQDGVSEGWWGPSLVWVAMSYMGQGLFSQQEEQQIPQGSWSSQHRNNTPHTANIQFVTLSYLQLPWATFLTVLPAFTKPFSGLHGPVRQMEPTEAAWSFSGSTQHGVCSSDHSCLLSSGWGALPDFAPLIAVCTPKFPCSVLLSVLLCCLPSDWCSTSTEVSK